MEHQQIALGNAALSAGRLADAENHFRSALAASPNSNEALRSLGLALFQSNKLDEALSVLETTIARAPGDLLARLLMGRLFLRLQEPAAAETHFLRILKKIPTSEPARSGLIDAALAQGRIAEAERLTKQILTLNPRSETGLFAAARVAEMQNDHSSALDQFDKLLKVAPDNPSHRYHRSRALLHFGRFEEGWRDYEFRFAAGAAQLPRMPSPRWTGAPVDRLLLVSEQGLGDTLQFARFIPLLKPLTKHLTLVCPASMASLLERSFEIGTVDAAATYWPEHDAHLPLMSLPSVLSLGENALAPVGRYLRPDPGRVALWEQRLAVDPARLNVGVVYATSIAHATEQRPQTRRSCKPDDLKPLSAIAGGNIINLQLDSTGAPEWQSPPEKPADFDDTAAIVDLLDAVLCVDTAVTHVAGALNKPVALLLPFVADWRWGQHLDHSDWYPSARLFRQAHPGVWSEPVIAAAEWLKRIACEKTAANGN